MSQPIIVYSTTWCPDCIAAKAVLKSMQVAYEDINIDQDPEAADKVIALNNGNRSVPTIIFPDGSMLTEPRMAELRHKLQSLSQFTSSPGPA